MRHIGMLGIVAAVGLLGAMGLRADEPVSVDPSRLDASQMGRVGSGADGGGFIDTVSFSGSIDVAYTYNWNNSKTGGVENPTRVFDVRHNEFTVHNAILYVSREANEEQLFGFGLAPTIGADSAATDLSGAFAGASLDLLEAKINAFIPGVGANLEIGKFLTDAGGEVIYSHKQLPFSRSFLFGNAIPYTHVGFRLSKSLVDRDDGASLVSAKLGYSNGWDNFTNSNDGHVVLSTLALAPADFFETKVNWFFGLRDAAGAGDNNSFSHLVDIVSTVKIPGVEGASVALNFDWYGDENVGGGYAQYYGIAGILGYEFDNMFSESEDDKFYLAFRGEFVDNDDGFLTMSGSGSNVAASELWDLTWTLGYRPTSNMLVRFEVRYDKADSKAFEDGLRSQQTTFAVNTVFHF